MAQQLNHCNSSAFGVSPMGVGFPDGTARVRGKLDVALTEASQPRGILQIDGRKLIWCSDPCTNIEAIF